MEKVGQHTFKFTSSSHPPIMTTYNIFGTLDHTVWKLVDVYMRICIIGSRTSI